MCAESIRSVVGVPLAVDLDRWQRLHSVGDFTACEKLARGFAVRLPKDGLAQRYLGLSLLLLGRTPEACEVLARASALRRHDPAVWDNYGVALQHGGRHREATNAFRESLRLDPANPSVWTNAASNQVFCGDGVEALRLASRAVQLAPTLVPALHVQGQALAMVGRPAEAEDFFHKSLQIDPRYGPALIDLGRILFCRGALEDARQVTLAALDVAPASVEAHANLALVLCLKGDLQDAIFHYGRAAELRPGWHPALSGILFCHAHSAGVSPQSLFEEHRRIGARIEADCVPADPWSLGREREPERPLRLGFVSGDLCDHPVARFIEPFWRELDQGQFQIFAYMTGTVRDEVSVRLGSHGGVWRNAAALDDAALEALIREDRIDILFDLSGHTAGGRPGVFAGRAAPVQVSWIGYPATTGLQAMDYRLVDEVVAPPGKLDWQFTERLAYIPVMSVFERPEGLPAVTGAPAAERGFLTFGSFNRANKIHERVIGLWSRILHGVPRARLVIGAVSQGREDELIGRFAAHGIEARRLDLRPRMALPDYLGLHAEVDLLLDTFPFSSGTTANFGLWMGVPSITLAGATLLQRLCASRLHAAGLEGFIAESEQQYLELAVGWSARVDELAALRGQLRARMEDSAQVEPRRLARALEGRLRQMWRLWCAGRSPETLN